MWIRWIYILRGLAQTVRAGLGSWRLSIVVLVVTAQFHLLLCIWATQSPAEIVRGIAKLLPFWGAYAVLLANTAVCMWRRWPVLLRELNPRSLCGRVRPRWTCRRGVSTDATEARRQLRRMGFSPAAAPAGGLWASRCRLAALGSLCFHLALFPVAVGFLLTLTARQETKLAVAVGETFASADNQYLSATRRLPDLGFTVERVTPRFWGDMLLFTELEAQLRMADGSRVRTRINRPIWIGPADYMRLSSVGYAPRYEVLDARGRVLESAVVKLNAFPPGKRDRIVLEGYPHRVYVRIFPDLDPAAFPPATRSMNLSAPGVEAEVFRGKLAMGQGMLRRGQALSVEGLHLHFPEVRYWAELTVVYDPGAALIFAGFGLGLLGLLLRARGRRAELCWSIAPTGEAVLEGFGAVERPGWASTEEATT